MVAAVNLDKEVGLGFQSDNFYNSEPSVCGHGNNGADLLAVKVTPSNDAMEKRQKKKLVPEASLCLCNSDSNPPAESLGRRGEVYPGGPKLSLHSVVFMSNTPPEWRAMGSSTCEDFLSQAQESLFTQFKL